VFVLKALCLYTRHKEKHIYYINGRRFSVMEVRALHGHLSCWEGSARGETRYGEKWAWLAGHGRCMASSWVQQAVRVDWGLSSNIKQCSNSHCWSIGT